MGQQNAAGGQTDGGESEPTVLFVDDESGMLEVYELKYDPYFTVLTASGGEEALDVFGDHVDFAFVDRRMPDIPGDDVIRRLRDRGYETPVGILSAIDPDVDLGVDHEVYLTKPPSEDRVREVVRSHTA